MLVALAMVIGGAALLAFAGDKFVDLAAALAERLRISAAVIGLTIVAAGTSAPELFVSVAAALGGAPAIAMGNVVGSNIANIGFILGGCALFGAIPFGQKIFAFEYPCLVLASWIALLLCRDGMLDRLESGFFLGSMIGFVWYVVWVARSEVGAREKRELTALVPEQADRLSHRPAWFLVAGLLLSLAALAAGADVMVRGAVQLARGIGVSERVVGLTVVAVGTSLPELVTSVIAAMKRQHEMAVSNVVGSNIFNLLMILGTTGLIRPVPVEPRTIAFDLWAMLLFTLAPLPFVIRGFSLSRGGGFALLVLYVSYVVIVAVS
jgi:cation:H+ antiporter